MPDDETRNPNERRQGPRISPAKPLPARVRMLTDAFIRNLSVGGALIDSGRALAPGSRCEVHLELDGVAVVATAKVVRCHMLGGSGSRYESGLEFEGVDEKTRLAIEQILKAARSGEPVPGQIKT